jgi:hypothetical protein
MPPKHFVGYGTRQASLDRIIGLLMINIKPDSNNLDDQDDLDTRGDEALEMVIEDYATTM